VKRIAPKGVHAVLDGVGKDTFTPSLDCMRPFGIIVNYGNASGHVPPLDILDLSKKGALSVSRPGLSHYLKDIDEFRAAANELFALVQGGTIGIEIGRSYPLKDAADAHRDVESRQFAGSVVLIP
jgi:NADPH:quinone reductase